MHVCVCMCMGRKVPSLVAAKFAEWIDELVSMASFEIIAMCKHLGDVDQHRTLDNWEKGWIAIVFEVQLKQAIWQELPILFCIRGHGGPYVACMGMVEAKRKYEVAKRAGMPLLNQVVILEDGLPKIDGGLWEHTNQFIGGDCLLRRGRRRLQYAAGVRAMRTKERGIDQRMSELSSVYKRAPAASGAYVSTEALFSIFEFLIMTKPHLVADILENHDGIIPHAGEQGFVAQLWSAKGHLSCNGRIKHADQVKLIYRGNLKQMFRGGQAVRAFVHMQSKRKRQEYYEKNRKSVTAATRADRESKLIHGHVQTICDQNCFYC